MSLYDTTSNSWTKPALSERFGTAGLAIVIVVAIESAVLFASALMTSYGYHRLALNEIDGWERHLELAYLVVGFFVAMDFIRGRRDISAYINTRTNLNRLFPVWLMAFVVLIGTLFITKTAEQFSRAAVVLTFFSGFAALALARLALSRLVNVGARYGLVTVRRMMLVGNAEEIELFMRRYRPWTTGLRIAAIETVNLGSEGILPEARMSDIIATARRSSPDDIVLLLPWSNRDAIIQVTNNLMILPAAVHMGPERVFHRFDNLRVAQIGNLSTLNLIRVPLRPMDLFIKRTADIALATLSLILLLPLLLVAAVLIKLDSPGPVLFLQRRYGFNQRSFTIYKLRTMTTMENGAAVTQVQRNDPRVTRVGRFLRRTNIDELPQLLNVLKGDMSLVGPRPHATAHDEDYVRRIDLYARRHNVKPGITGWAQVNGFRGPTETDDKMRERVNHDLYYIDNWSLFLDLKIMVMTLLSPKSYQNAL